MFPDGYRGVHIDDSFDKASARAKQLTAQFNCKVSIQRTEGASWAVGVPDDAYRALMEQVEEDGKDENGHPMDRIEAMFHSGELSEAQYEEYREYWDERRGQPDPRWSESDNIRMEE